MSRQIAVYFVLLSIGSLFHSEGLHRYANAQKVQSEIERLVELRKLIESSDANSLPSLLDSLDEKLSGTSPNFRLSIISLATDRAVTLGLSEHAISFYETLLKKLNNANDSEQIGNPSLLFSYATLLQKHVEPAVVREKLKAVEPPKSNLLAHSIWVRTYFPFVPDEGGATALYEDELKAIGNPAWESENWPLISLKAEVMLSYASQLKGLKRAEQTKATVDYVQTALDHSIESDRLVRVWIEARTLEFDVLKRDPVAARAWLDRCLGELDALKLSSRNAAVARERLERMKLLIDAEATRSKLIGSLAPELKVGAIAKGQIRSIAELKGKVVLLHFYSVLTPAQLLNFSHVKKWHDELCPKGLVIVGISGRENVRWIGQSASPRRANSEIPIFEEVSAVTKFAAKHQLPYPLLIGEKGSENQQAYGLSRAPACVLIDQQGVIRMIVNDSEAVRSEVLDQEIRHLLSQP